MQRWRSNRPITRMRGIVRSVARGAARIAADGDLFQMRIPNVDALNPAPAPRAIFEHGHVLTEPA